MDAKVHRAIFVIAAKRAQERIQREGKQALVDLEDAFWAIHQGNWLTDMNQATCFLNDDVEGSNPYAVLDNKGRYHLPSGVMEHASEWTEMFHELWAHECVDSGLGALLPKNAGTGSPLNAQIIGGYYPMDHFDVVDPVDAQGRIISREAEEFEARREERMTLTAYDGVFQYTRGFWLHSAFCARKKDRKAPYNLRGVGHAAHTLQDFFGHSNFVELLLKIGAARGMLDEGLSSALGRERTGTFDAFWQADERHPEATPVMTGRFDRIDTLASILGIYRRGMLEEWSDLDAGGLGGADGSRKDLIFDVMFGTFSNYPFVAKAAKPVRELMEARRGLKQLKKAVKVAVLGRFARLAGRLGDEGAKSTIDEIKGLVDAMEPEDTRRYAMIGKIFHLEHMIEGKLRKEVREATGPKLPHHTLIAKDHDVSHPEVRLAYKLSCLLATEVTTELLYHYAIGSSITVVDDLLGRYYRHPELYLLEPEVAKGLRARGAQLYGERWWIAAEADEPLL